MMKSPLLVSVVAIALGVAALAVSLGSSPTPEASQETGALDVPWPSELALRVDELERQNQVLREQLAELQLRPVPAAAPRSLAGQEFVTQEQLDALREELLQASSAAASAMGAGANPEVFQQQVASAWDNLRREETSQKIVALQEKRLQRLDETVAKMESQLGLTGNQPDQMRRALLAQHDRDAELTRRWEAGEDDEVLGELKRNNRESHLEDLSGFLTPDQLERYREGGRGK